MEWNVVLQYVSWHCAVFIISLGPKSPFSHHSNTANFKCSILYRRIRFHPEVWIFFVIHAGLPIVHYFVAPATVSQTEVNLPRGGRWSPEYTAQCGHLSSPLPRHHLSWRHLSLTKDVRQGQARITVNISRQGAPRHNNGLCLIFPCLGYLRVAKLKLVEFRN